MRACITIGETELRTIIARHVATQLGRQGIDAAAVWIDGEGAGVEIQIGAGYPEDEGGESNVEAMAETLDRLTPDNLALVEGLAAELREAPAVPDVDEQEVPEPELAEPAEAPQAEIATAEPGAPDWTDDEIDRALRGLKAGASEETIAVNLGREIDEVYDLLDELCPKRSGVEINAALKRWKAAEDATILEAKAAGKSSYEIAAKLSGRKMADIAARLRELEAARAEAA